MRRGGKVAASDDGEGGRRKQTGQHLVADKRLDVLCVLRELRVERIESQARCTEAGLGVLRMCPHLAQRAQPVA